MIKVEGIAKSYRKRQVLSEISFEAKAGDCVGIIGANGCGKSTLLAILAGALKSDSGAIFYSGQNMMEHPKLFLEYAAYVPQENPLLEELTVYENLKLWYSKQQMKEIFTDGLPLKFSLSKVQKEKVSHLSGGIKKRLNIACALNRNQKILLLDEPGAALDAACKEDIRNYLQDYRTDGGTIVLTSHEEMEISLCNQLYLMEEGKLTQINAGLSMKEIAFLIRKQEEVQWKK